MLIASLDRSTTSFTDRSGRYAWTGSGYGHSHYYRVVAVNRWENRLTAGGDTLRLPVGSSLSTVYTGGARVASAQTAASGDFTAPAAPSFTVTGNADRTNTVSWTGAAWVGSGPTTAREAGWFVQFQSSNEGNQNLTGAAVAGTTSSYVHASRPTGRWSEYRVLGVNASGTGGSQSHARVWQRPATPTCSATAASTRSVAIGAGALPATADESYATYQTRIASGGWVPNGTATDPLYDNTTYGFRVRVLGAGSGMWSDEGACSGTTVRLATPVISIWGVTTRGAGTSASCTNGSSCTSSIAGGAASRNDLSDGTYHGVSASNTDGYNDVGSTSGFTTLTLATPAYPTCSASASSAYAPTTVSYSSDGWLTKTSEWAASAGTYTATATKSITDGWNTNTRSTSCSVQVAPPPVPGPVNVGVCYGARHVVGPAGSGGSGFGGIGSIQVCFGGSAGATGYQAQYMYYETGGNSGWISAGAVSPGGWETIATCIYPKGTTAYGPRVRVRATNAYGVSSWTEWTSTSTGGVLACV